MGNACIERFVRVWESLKMLGEKESFRNQCTFRLFLAIFSVSSKFYVAHPNIWYIVDFLYIITSTVFFAKINRENGLNQMLKI